MSYQPNWDIMFNNSLCKTFVQLEYWRSSDFHTENTITLILIWPALLIKISSYTPLLNHPQENYKLIRYIATMECRPYIYLLTKIISGVCYYATIKIRIYCVRNSKLATEKRCWQLASRKKSILKWIIQNKTSIFSRA